jgi:hypothetical protein
MEKDNIQNSFNTTLIDSNLENLGIDISELAIDSVLQDGLLRDIPIVGTIINLSKFGANVHDRLFLKKLLSFLNKLESIPSDKRKELIENIENSKKYRMKVGEKLLYIIDSCEDYEISELVGFLFKAFTEEKITYDDFLKGASVLKKLNMSDFKWFIKERKSYYFDLDDVGDLLSSGLFELHYEQLDVQVRDQDDYKVLRDSPYASKYKTEVDGGGVSVHLSRAGEIILEIFCPSYIKPKTMKV